MAENDIKIKVSIDKFESSFKRPIGKIQSGLSGLGRKLSMVAKTAKKMALPIAAIGAAIGVVGAAAIKAAGNFEQQRVAFETMLGSAEKADKLLRQIEEFSASTPFQLPGLIEGSKRLLAFGVAAEDVVDTMSRLGDLAQGDQEKLNRLTDAFGKLRAKGKATLEEINRFTEAGVPLVDALAKNFGKTTQEVLELVTKGTVGFKDVEKAVVSLTSEGGKFFNLTNKQAGTFNGLLSTMKDNIGLVAKDIGELLLPAAKEIVKFITGAAKAVREFISARIDLHKATKESIQKENKLTIKQLELRKRSIEQALRLNKISINKQLGDQVFLHNQRMGLMMDLARIEKQIGAKKAEESVRVVKEQEAEKTRTLKAAIDERNSLQSKAGSAQIQSLIAQKTEETNQIDIFNRKILALTKSQNKEIAAIAKAVALFNIATDTREAAMAAYSSLAGIPVVGPFLGAAAAATAIAFGIEQARAVSSATPGFQDGGIVPGNSFTGDRVPIRANSGESVITKDQQQRLLDIADGRVSAGGQAGGDLSVTLRTENRIIAEAVVEGYNTGRNLDLITKLDTN